MISTVVEKSEVSTSDWRCRVAEVSSNRNPVFCLLPGGTLRLPPQNLPTAAQEALSGGFVLVQV